MARSPVIAVGGLIALLASGSAASASEPGPISSSGAGVFRATCDRAVGTFGRRDVSIGRLAAVRAVRGYADPATAGRFADEEVGGFRFKAPLAVRRGRAVTISVARADRDWAAIGIDGQTRFHTVHFPACSRDASASRYERKWASWVNGFRLERLGCVRLVARERGSDEVSRTTVSFGMGRGGCSASSRAAARATVFTTPPAPLVPTRGCRTRIESGRGPIPFRQRGATVIGPVSLATSHIGDPDDFKSFFNERRGVYNVKAGLSVKAGRVVSLAIAPEARDGADMVYAPWEDENTPPVESDIVRFKSCKRDTRAFSYDGVVGSSTAFSGGWVLKEPACIPVEVRQRGSRRVWRDTISFGMGERCE